MEYDNERRQGWSKTDGIRMPRVIKHPEIRRAEILDAAFAMFIERGYDNVSLNDIIDGAGLSKGMLYHHFASKEALLEALFDRITEKTYEVLAPIIAAKDVDPKRRLEQLLTASREDRLRSVEFSRSVFVSLLRPESRDLYHRIEAAWAKRMRPILTQLVWEGVKAGAFKTDDPEGAGDLILQVQMAAKYLVEQGATARTSRERDAAASALEKRIEFHAKVISDALGLKRTLTFGPPDFARKFIKALNPVGRARKA
ncbi:TetR/AcrR family transcriptional regulator [Mesorhizobium sp. B1-1-7]|nr:TetR/AcrR family transcriptional regulator [Mesorhizobium sp. B1-1-7]